MTPVDTVISTSIFNQTLASFNLGKGERVRRYLLVVLNAHRQRVNKDGNHDPSAEVSAANDEFQFSPEDSPAALQQPRLWLRHLCISVARAAAMTGAVAMAGGAVDVRLAFWMFVIVVVKLVVVDAVRTY